MLATVATAASSIQTRASTAYSPALAAGERRVKLTSRASGTSSGLATGSTPRRRAGDRTESSRHAARPSDGTRRTPDERRDLNLVPSYSFVGDGKRPRGLDSTREGGGDDANAAPYRGCLGCRIVADQGAGTRFSLVFDKTFLPELPG